MIKKANRKQCDKSEGHSRHFLLLSLFAIICSLTFLRPQTVAAQRSQEDNQNLSIAIDYFQGGKYHEALVIFSRLDSLYRLNPRIRAYTALCYFYEDDFHHASRIFDEVLPKLKAFSPEERSIYYKADADSHFELHQYDKAETAYDSLLAICPEKEKAEPYYRKGFIDIYNKVWMKALDDLQSSLVYYRRYQPDAKARTAQIKNMIEGVCENINKGL